MRSLVPLLLIVLACGLAGCSVSGASPDTAFADSQPADSTGQIVVAQKPVGGADDAIRESCGGR
jgi:hypothetical protein